MAKTISASLGRMIQQIKLVAFDFDGVFTDNGVYVFADGTEAVRCSRGDGLGIGRLMALGIGCVVISTETNPIVSVRCRKLGIECIQGCAEKGAVMDELMTTRGLVPDEIAFVGNDVNDLPCFRRVRLSIAVRDAHPDALAQATYVTRAPGGNGAVREVCDLFETVHGPQGKRQSKK